MKYILLILLSAIFISCNNDAQTDKEPGVPKTSDAEKTTSSGTDQRPIADVSGCYMKILGRDTAILMIEQKGLQLTGKLLYDNFEKDGSWGTVKGKEDAEIIKLWYDFNSEGMHSVMEVYFKKDNGRLLRGVGSMDQKTDTTYFTSGINYSDKEAFNKIDCSRVESKLKF